MSVTEAAPIEVLQELGQSTNGSTYKVQEPGTARSVALKRIFLGTFPENNRGLLREALTQGVKKARSLSHPGIATVIDLIEEPSAVGVRRDLVDGLSLATLSASNSLPANGPLLHFLRQAAEALDYAHRRGVMHGAIKPTNILISAGSATAERHAKITDFGLAPFLSMLREMGAAELTPYASPEQRISGTIDARSDQYSLAATIYTLLCGQPPSPVAAEKNGDAESIQALNSTLSASADKVLTRALSENPAGRFPSCAALVSTLGVALNENPRWQPAAMLVAPLPESHETEVIPVAPSEPAMPQQRAEPVPASEIIPPPATELPAAEAFSAAPEPELELTTPVLPVVEAPLPEPPVEAPVLEAPEAPESETLTAAAAPRFEETIYWPNPDPERPAAVTNVPAQDFATASVQEFTESLAGESFTQEPVAPAKPKPIVLPFFEDDPATDAREVPPEQTREYDLAARRRRHAYYGDRDYGEPAPVPEEIIGRKKSILPKVLIGLVACLALVAFGLYETVWHTQSDLPTQVLDTESGPVTPPPADNSLPVAKTAVATPAAGRRTVEPRPDASERSLNGSAAAAGIGVAQEEFLSEPAGAKITVDGRPELSCTTPCTLSLQNGRHTAILAGTGFSEARRIFSVPEDTTLFVPLARNAGILVLTSTPSGSTIVVDGQQQGQTPATLHLSTGKHQVVLLYGAMRHEETVNIDTDGFQARSLNWETP